MRTLRRWFEKLHSGEFTRENQLRSRHEIKLDNAGLETLVEADTSQTTHELTSRLVILIPTLLHLLNEISKVKKLDKWISHQLNEVQIVLKFPVVWFHGTKPDCFPIVLL